MWSARGEPHFSAYRSWPSTSQRRRASVGDDPPPAAPDHGCGFPHEKVRFCPSHIRQAGHGHIRGGVIGDGPGRIQIQAGSGARSYQQRAGIFTDHHGPGAIEGQAAEVHRVERDEARAVALLAQRMYSTSSSASGDPAMQCS